MISKLFIKFIFFAFLGYIYEMIHMRITTKKLVNRGYLQGPIIPVYGVGMIIITVLLDSIKSNFILTFILSVLIIATTEYLTGVIIEKIYKIRLWDYSKRKFNINGLVCLNTMVQFVIMALFTLYFVNPIFTDFLNNANTNILKIISIIFLVIFLIDFSFSSIMLNKFTNECKSKRKDVTRDYKKYINKNIKK